MSLTAYAILRHHLMDIEFVIKRSFVYSILVALIVGLYSLIIFISQVFFGNIIGFRWLLALIGAALIAIGFKPLETAFTNFTDKYFFKGKYDYQKTLKELSRAARSIFEVDELLNKVIMSIVETIKTKNVFIYVLDKKSSQFLLRRSVITPQQKIMENKT
ncbi:MAG: hypothetical protein ABH860_04625, partial [bacterium]